MIKQQRIQSNRPGHGFLEDLSVVRGDAKDNFAIVQGGAWGDNINSTLMLQPIKSAFPNSKIHVYTSDIYSSAFENNSYIDKLILYKCLDKNQAINLTIAIPPLISNMGYKHIFAPHPMFNPSSWSCINHPEWGENLIFSWVRALEDFGIGYDKLQTVLQPTESEMTRASSFFESTPSRTRYKILMETFGESGQTFFDFRWLDKVVRLLASKNHIVYISNKNRNNVINALEDQYPNNVVFAGNLSIRECAVLFNNCDCFISVSSGLSNACNTNCCKTNIKWIEVVNSITCSSAAIRKDDKTFWHNNDLDKFCQFLDSEV